MKRLALLAFSAKNQSAYHDLQTQFDGKLQP